MPLTRERWSSPLSSHHRLLHAAIVLAVVPYMYSVWNEQHRSSSHSLEESMVRAWEKMITQPSVLFRRAVVGFNSNVDVIVPGTRLAEQLNVTSDKHKGEDHEVLGSLTDLYETFNYFFSRGAAAEKYMSDEPSFERVSRVAEACDRAQFHLGGNAALIADKIATSFPRTEAYLVGPIGPRSSALLHPSVRRTNSTRIVKDEVHVIMEYKQGEIVGEHVAPSSSRFIFSHDHFSGSTVVIEMFFKAIQQFQPDLVVMSGVHLLEYQPKEIRMEKLRLIRRNLMQVPSKIPIHLELGSLGESAFASDVLHKIIPFVDSLGLNEQELAFLSKIGEGPFPEEHPVHAGTLHTHKAVDILHWLLHRFGRGAKTEDGNDAGFRLQRIHFHCRTFHVMVSTGSDWSNLASGLAAGARLAGRVTCGMHRDNEFLEVRVSPKVDLDKKIGKTYQFNPHNPVASWMRDECLFIYTPVLVCRLPTKTVGMDDAIAASGLLYSQFYRMEKHW